MDFKFSLTWIAISCMFQVKSPKKGGRKKVEKNGEGEAVK